MATMNVSLPDQMKQWVERRAASGRYSNSSDVLRDLIRQEQDREAIGLTPAVRIAIERGLGHLGDPARFVDHDTAMGRLDAAVTAVTKPKS